MTTEELLKPRYEVIADYPFSDCEVGKVFTEGELEDTFFNNLKKYPHIFKRLEWWHKRNSDELPKYIGYKDEYNVFKWVYPVVKYISVGVHEAGVCIISFTNSNNEYAEIDQQLWGITPATEEEYTNYLNQ